MSETNTQEHNWSETIDNVASLNLEGNIIPHCWYNHICFPSGKPDLIGMMILAEIVYWYRPKAIKCESTGKLLGQTKRFSGDMLQRSLKSFAEQFGITKRQAQDALMRLKKLGVVETQLRTVRTKSSAMGNVLYIAPVTDKLKQIESAVPLIRSNVLGGTKIKNTENIDVETPSYDRTYEVVRSNVGGHTIERMTYTENTTEITTDSSKQYTPSQESNSEQSVKSDFAAASFPENLNCQTDKPLVNDRQLESVDHSQAAAVCSTGVLASSGNGKPDADVRPASHSQQTPASERVPAPIQQPTKPQPQAVTTQQTAPTQPPNKTIGHVISQGQSHVIRQRMIDLAKGSRLGAVSIDDAVLAVERILVDTSQFAAAGDDFAHKLNIVCKQIRERRIDLRPQQAPAKKAEPSREQSIREEIRKLKIERNSAEQARSRGLMAEELCVADINRLSAKIGEFERELSQLSVVVPSADTAANCIVHLAERRAVL